MALIGRDRGFLFLIVRRKSRRWIATGETIVLTIDTPADDQNLVALSDVKTALGIAGTDQDGLLNILIAQVSSMIATHCNRVFIKEAVTETFRSHERRCPVRGVGFGTLLMLSRFPILSIGGIVENGVTLSPADYHFGATTGMVERLCGERVAHWAGTCAVTYSGGYDDDAHPVPADLQAAAIGLVSHLKHRASRDPTLRSSTVDGVSAASYEAAGAAIPDYIADVIDPYRMPAVG